MDEEILQRLHAVPDGYRGIVREMAAAHPDSLASALEAALLRVARDLDEVIVQGGDPTNEARTARKLAVLLRLDIGTAEGELGHPPTLGQMLTWWRKNDDFFLRL